MTIDQRGGKITPQETQTCSRARSSGDARWPDALAHLLLHPNDMPSDLVRALGCQPRTARRWRHRWNAHLAAEAAKARTTTRASELHPDDRALAVQTVRTLNAIVGGTVQRMRDAFDAAPGEALPDIPHGTPGALLSLVRCARMTAEAHPGLMALAKSEGAAKATKVDLDTILASINGAPAPADRPDDDDEHQDEGPNDWA